MFVFVHPEILQRLFMLSKKLGKYLANSISIIFKAVLFDSQGENVQEV